MTYALVFTEQYTRRAARFIRRHPELRQQYLKTLQLLEANPFHPSLRLHALSGRLAGLHSVSINLSYRITLELMIQDGEIIPINVGDHDAVYQRRPGTAQAHLLSLASATMPRPVPRRRHVHPHPIQPLRIPARVPAGQS